MNNTSQVHFNLTGIDLTRALENGSKGFNSGIPNNVTNVELFEILNNGAWFAKTTFYLDGKPLSPEAVIRLFMNR